MAELFSDEWINKLKDAWNADPEVSGKLAEAGFDSMICAGFKGEDTPKVAFKVEKGVAVSAGLYNGEKADWDMRASAESWAKWQEKGLGLVGLAKAYATGELKFATGDYATMVKNPKLTGPFGKCFKLMSEI